MSNKDLIANYYESNFEKLKEKASIVSARYNHRMDAEDILHECFIELAKTYGKLERQLDTDEVGKLFSAVMKPTASEILRKMRGISRRAYVHSISGITVADDKTDKDLRSVEYGDILNLVEDTLKKIEKKAPKRVKIFRSFVLEGKAGDIIAEEENIKPKSVYEMTYIARKELASQLGASTIEGFFSR